MCFDFVEHFCSGYCKKRQAFRSAFSDSFIVCMISYSKLIFFSGLFNRLYFYDISTPTIAYYRVENQDIFFS